MGVPGTGGDTWFSTGENSERTVTAFESPTVNTSTVLHLGSLDSAVLFTLPVLALLHCFVSELSFDAGGTRSVPLRIFLSHCSIWGRGSRVGRRAFGAGLQPGSLLPRDFSHASYS